ncbi:MAG TPA: leukotoxin LktA family filamentous adhesin [Pseudolabrys sp.]
MILGMHESLRRSSGGGLGSPSKAGLALRWLAIFLSSTTAFVPPLAYGQQAGVNVIVPDGRSATSVQSAGSVTNITTRTVSGNTGFNSFSQFKEGAGNTVNLMLPGGTSNLVNIVRDGPVVIDGILNSYKNGSIGGNVFFADPFGFVVGKSGVVNVGALNVSTPKSEFLDGILGAGGTVNAAAAARLMSGDFPVSPDGSIAIHGRVNAADGAKLLGQNISIGSMSPARAEHIGHAARFAASVNSKGLKSGGGIVVRNGSIQIVAAGGVNVSGRLAARSKVGKAGDVSITAGKNIKVASSASISAKGTAAGADGGNIVLKADNNLTVKSGANFDVSSKDGSGGFVDLSAKNVADLGAIKFNLAAPNGTAGSLLIDPTDLVISDNASYVLPGSNVSLLADHSITITSTGVIDTRVMSGLVTTGNSGNITLAAPIITVNGQLLADVSAGSAFQGGDVTLTATHSASLNTGHAVADAEIVIAGIVAGHNIILNSSATSEVSLLLPEPLPESIGALDPDNPLHFGGFNLFSESVSKVTIASGANVTASGNFTMQATGKEAVSDPLINLIAGGIYTSASVIAQVKSNVSSTVKAGAVIAAGGNISIQSANDAALNVVSEGASGFKTSAQVQDSSKDQTVKTDPATTIAFGGANINTASNVETGARLATTGNVSVTAYNTSAFSTTATVYVANGGNVGVSAAFGETATNATAWLGANLGAANAKVGNVTVEANDSTSANSFSASTLVTDAKLADGSLASHQYDLLGRFGIQQYKSVVAVVEGDAISAVSAKLFTSKPAASDKPDAAAALSLVSSTHSASAMIDSDHAANSVAPVILSGGDVAVVSSVVEKGIANAASSEVTAQQQKPGTSDPGSKLTVSAAVAVGEYAHNATALIGSGAKITAADVGVGATSPTPLTLTLDWSDLQSLVASVTDPLSFLASSQASAASNSSKLAIAGSVNYYDVNSNTVAWIGSGVQITQTNVANVTGLNGWQTALIDGTNFAWLAPVAVQASTNVLGIARAGGSLDATAADAKGVGASIAVTSYEANTIAGIGDGVIVNADGNVAVDASATQRLFSWVNTSGAGGGMAVNGMSATILLDDVTHASISNRAVISAASVAVNALQDMTIVSVSGSPVPTKASSTSVGLSVAVTDLSADTGALIGDNSGDIIGVVDTRGLAVDAGAGAGGAIGFVHTNTLAVGATTSGSVYAIGVAATTASDEPPKAKKSTSTDKADAATDTAAQSKPPETTFGLSISGSSAALITSFTTNAAISNAVIDRLTNTGNTAVSVQALNNMTRMAITGAMARAVAVNDGKSSETAIAGTLSLGLTSDSTNASISGSTLADTKSVNVYALAGGLDVFAALGVAQISGGTNAQNSNAAAGSASIGIVTDSVHASIINSTISGVNGATGAALGGVSVIAYQQTDIGIGGGSGALGGKGGYGLAYTYASISDPSGGNATDARIYNTGINTFSTVNVVATDRSHIYSGAAVAAVADNNAGAASIIINNISPTTSASIDADPAQNKAVNVAGDVTVAANGVQNAALESIISAAVVPDPNGSPIDFSGQAAQDNVDSTNTIAATGAAIVSVAGQVAVTKSADGTANIGASSITNLVSQNHTATVDHTAVTTAGNVLVSATDGTTILSIGSGIGISKGKFAGQAAVTVNQIDSSVTASVGGSDATNTDTQINANSLTVHASNNSDIRSFATVAAYADSAAAGLAIAYNEIGGSMTASLDGAKVVTAGDVIVQANADADVWALSIGVAVSKEVGIAGSSSTNYLLTDVLARIGGGADVAAGNNVGVLASNTDTIEVIGGALGVSKGPVGIGISIVVNDIEGSTQALVSGATTKVDAKAQLANQVLAVNNGDLVHAIDIGAFNAPIDATPDMTEQQDNVHGLAVVATSHQAAVANAVSAGVSKSVAVGLTPIVNLMGGTTRAAINDAQIDTRVAGGLPAIEVIGSSVSYTANFAIGAAGGNTVGGGGASVANRMDRSTFATIANATIGTPMTDAAAPLVGAVKVHASGIEDSSILGVGFGVGGTVGIGASLGINLFDADTEASVVGGSMKAASLIVKADGSNGIFAAVGSGAFGGTVGVASSVVVSTSRNRTTATIGAANTVTDLWLTSVLDDEAHSINVFDTYTVGGAGAGSVGVAGMAAVSVVENTTIAGLYGVNLNKFRAGSGDVTVLSDERISFNQVVGALGVGGAVGVGASASVVSIKSNVTGEIQSSTINSAGDVAVSANSVKDIEAITVTVGAGGTVGIGGSVGLILIGSNNGDPASRQSQSNELENTDGGSQGTLASVNNFSSDAPAGDGAVADGSPGTHTPTRSASYDVSSVLNGGDDRVAAVIYGGSVTGNAVSAVATSSVHASSIQGGVGLGGTVGIGASVGFTSIYDTVVSSIQSSVTARSVNATATMSDNGGHAADVLSAAAGGGLIFGGDASIALASVSDVVSASVGGDIGGDGVHADPTITVTAADSTSIHSEAHGLAGGLVAVGASAATADKSSTVTAAVENSAQIAASSLSVSAADAGSVYARTVALTGGVFFAGSGSGSSASDTATVSSSIGNDSALNMSAGAVSVSASATPDVTTVAAGVAVSGFAGVGASVALSTITPTVSASVGNEVAFTGTGNLSVLASSNVLNDSASAYAAAGGLLLGVNATVAIAEDTANVSAAVGNNVVMPGGNLLVSASNNTNQYTISAGFAAGLIAAGANVAMSTSNTTTVATIGTDDAVNATSLNVTATGHDTNDANAIAGTGGVIAGSAATAITTANSTTRAYAVSNAAHPLVVSGAFNVNANHTTTTDGSVDTMQAAVIGASGSVLSHNMNSTVTATLDSGSVVQAGSIGITATNTVEKIQTRDWSISASGGGLINAAAAFSGIYDTQQTAATVGDNVSVHVVSPTRNANTLIVSADNETRVTERVRVDSGALIALAFAGGYATETNTSATVSIGQNTTLFNDVGNISLNAWSNIDFDIRAVANVYGLAGAPSGLAQADVNSANLVNLATGAIVEATDGSATLASGVATDGTTSHASVYTDVSMWNYTLEPAAGPPDAHSILNLTSDVNVSAGSIVRAADNIVLTGTRGGVNLSSTGMAKFVLLSEIASAISHVFGGGDIFVGLTGGYTQSTGVGTVRVDGLVFAGIQRTKSVTIDYANQSANGCDVTTTACLSVTKNLMDAQVVTTALTATQQRIATLQTLLADPNVDATAAGGYLSELAFLQQTTAGTAPGAQSSQMVVVPDVQARLGNIYINGDKAVGSGRIEVPGDASITVTNNTAASVVVNNMTIEAYLSGRLRFNGGLVNSNADINYYSGGGANFSSVITGLTQGLPVPLVKIVSNYDAANPLFYNANDTLFARHTAFVAPDITTSSGTVIDNQRGLVDISSQAGSVYAGGTISAGTVDINVRNGAFVQGYFGGIDHTGGDQAIQIAGTNPLWGIPGYSNGGAPQNAADLPAGTGILANGDISISAKWVNINSLIQSGIVNWQLAIPAAPVLTGSASALGIAQSVVDNLRNAIKNAQTPAGCGVSGGAMKCSVVNDTGLTLTYNYTTDRLELTQQQAAQDYGILHTPGQVLSSRGSSSMYALVSDYGNIGGNYDASADRYVVNSAATQGGYIKIYGQIINTSPTSGILRVLDGFGQINVTNASDKAVVIANLDAGLYQNGRGTIGMIDLTDIQSFDGATNGILRSVYQRVMGNDGTYRIALTTQTGTIDTTGKLTVLSDVTTYDVSTVDDRTSVYLPQAGLRYSFRFQSDGHHNFNTEEDCHPISGCGSTFLTFDTGLVPETFFKVSALDTVIKNTGLINTPMTNSNSLNEFTVNHSSSSNDIDCVSILGAEVCFGTQFNDFYQNRFNYYRDYTVKADFPIAIQFAGLNTGVVGIQSGTDVVLKGTINNPSGTTTVTSTAGSVLDPQALMRSRDIVLTAAKSIGVDGAPVGIELTGGSLTANAAQGPVVVAAAGDLVVKNVTSGGDPLLGQNRVDLSSAGDITGDPAGYVVKADRIDLTATGSIGTAADPLHLDIGMTTDPTMRPFGPTANGPYFGLTATAGADITIVADAWTGDANWAGNTNADMLINTVTAVKGVVTLATTGRMLDNNPIETQTVLTYAQEVALWDSLGLREGTPQNQARQDQAVTSYENNVTRDYQQYWLMQPKMVNGAYQVSSAEAQTLAQQYRTIDPTLTDAQVSQKIAAYAAGRTADFAQDAQIAGGLTASFDPTYHYTITAAEKTALLRGSSWTERQLEFTAPPALLNDVGAADIVKKTANITGLSVSLTAGQGLGEVLAPVLIPTNIDPANVTAEQKVAMETATREDFTLTDSLITIRSQRSLGISSTGTVDISVANGPAYITSPGNLHLGQVDISGTLRISAVESIVNAVGSHIITGDEILNSSNGGVGVIWNPVTEEWGHQPLEVTLRNGATVAGTSLRGTDLTVTGTTNISELASLIDINVVSTGPVIDVNTDGANSVHAVGAKITSATPNDPVSLIKLGTVEADHFTLIGDKIDVQNMLVASWVDLQGQDMFANITQKPHDPAPTLEMSVTGPNGSVGRDATFNIDANAVDFDPLRMTDTVINQTGVWTKFDNSYVDGSMILRTPDVYLVMDNRSQFPLYGPDIQLFAPGYAFNMVQDRNYTTTDTWITNYIVGFSATQTTYQGGYYTGGSMVRDSQRNMEDGEPGLFIERQGGNDDTPVYLLGNSPWLKIERGFQPYPVEFDEDEKPIKLSGF